MSESERAEGVVALVAGLHDCGKADPWFLSQAGAPVEVSSGFARNMVALGQAGLPPVPAQHVGALRALAGEERRLIRHEAMTGHALQRSSVPGWVSACLSGHHGRYQPDIRTPAVVARHRMLVDSSPWLREQDQVAHAVAEAVGLPLSDIPKGEIPGVLIVLMTGLACLADWCASDESFLDTHDSTLFDDDPRRYLWERMEEASAQVARTMGSPTRPRGGFSKLFPGLTPSREIQQWAVDRDPSRDGLVIVTAPPGEGKTEAALYLHSASEAGDGLVFALPTMATADAMFDRVRRFYATTPALGVLRHSTAALNAFYDPSAAQPVGVCDDDGLQGLAGSEWLAGRHRSMTAPVVVSTCDQVLAAAVNHKHLPVRMAALANKHLILDEAHTYDPYQDLLLRRLLGWLGRYGTRVTILSATLPKRRLRDYVAAYQEGAGLPSPEVDGAYPAVITAATAGVTTWPVAASRSYLHHVRSVPICVGAVAYRAFAERFADATIDYVRDLRVKHPGAVIGVVVNTVDRAIAIGAALEDHGEEVLMVHSRMTARQRTHATERLLRDYGPVSVHRPPRVVVATQVAEASLDLDVDILVTDLAPMTSLLQRMGRQWRHATPDPQGTWSHTVPRDPSVTAPTVHVLAAVDDHGALHSMGRFPYFIAELSKAWSVGLQHGHRTVIAIPGDLQGLVDCCDVSWDDLVTADDEDLPAIQERLGAAASQESAAIAAGSDAADVNEIWALDPVWDRCPALAALTPNITLWDETAVTRTRDQVTCQALIWDVSGSTEWAFPRDTSDFPIIRLPRGETLQAMGCVAALSGAVARAVMEGVPVPQEWRDQPTALLRSVWPVSVAQLQELGYALHPRFGVIKTEMTS